MNDTNSVQVRPLQDLDLGDLIAIDEMISGEYRPAVWETRIGYYLRRDPDASLVAEVDGKVVGFMLGEIRGGEFGLEETTGWIEVLGVDPEARGQAIGRRLAEEMIGYFKEQGAECVRTLVDSEMEGIAQFFEALGFEAAGPRPFVRDLT